MYYEQSTIVQLKNACTVNGGSNLAISLITPQDLSAEKFFQY